MKGPKSTDLWASTHALRELRTEDEFKEALKSGALPWTEIERYFEWRKAELKDSLITLRISSTDRMKLKSLARMQGKKFHSYIGEILKREIHLQEDNLSRKASWKRQPNAPPLAPAAHPPDFHPRS
jgi:predicted DNA binding CopG/RHH family protein